MYMSCLAVRDIPRVIVFALLVTGQADVDAVVSALCRQDLVLVVLLLLNPDICVAIIDSFASFQATGCYRVLLASDVSFGQHLG